MKTKNQIIAELKELHPTLRTGDDIKGYTLLGNDDYEATINQWAGAELLKLQAEAEVEAKATAKTALLDRLGINADEAQLLLS